MLDLYNLDNSDNSVFVFKGNSPASGVSWRVWNKPRGKTMANIFLLGAGGNGGQGVIGAVSTAAGGAGGGSSSQATLTIPLAFLPPQLYISLPTIGTGGAAVSYVGIYPSTVANYLVLTAKGGSNGGNGTGATAGVAGVAGFITAIADCPLAAAGNFNFLAGQAGAAGGAAVFGPALTLPVTGLRCIGGTGGGGLPATTGSNGGNYTVTPILGTFPVQSGGIGPTVATNPAAPGRHGSSLNINYFYGGTGSSSTHGTATGGGLAAAPGGNAAPGAGGGGVGGALTGSAAATVGLGGEGLCIITCW